MGSSGGSSKNVWDQGADIGMNFLTLGYAGYQDGKIRSGYIGGGLQKGWDTISGRKAIKEAEAESNRALDVEQVRRAEMQRQELVKREAMDRQASSAAQAIRNSAPSNNSFSRPSYRLNPDQDFLGL